MDGACIVSAFRPDGSQLADFELRQEGLYTLGNGLEASFQLDDPGLEMKHLAFLLGEDGLLMQTNGQVQLGNHSIQKPVAIADGDILTLGSCTLKVTAPRTGVLSRGRVGETLWTLRPAADEWNISEETGVFRPVPETSVMENLSLQQDSLTHKTLLGYIDGQTYRMKAYFPDFTHQVEETEPKGEMDEMQIVTARYTFNNKPLVQLQAYGLHGPFVAIAVWTVPPFVSARDEAFARFDSYLNDVLRFH